MPKWRKKFALIRLIRFYPRSILLFVRINLQKETKVTKREDWKQLTALRSFFLRTANAI